MKQEGFPTLLPLLEALWDSKNHRLQSRVGYFYSQGGFQSLVGRVIQHSRFAPDRRSTQGDTESLAETQIGKDITHLLLRIIRREFQNLREDQESRPLQMRACDMTAEVVSQFSFKERETFYLDNAPILSCLIRELCDVKSTEAEPTHDEPGDDGEDTEESDPDTMEPHGPKAKSRRSRAKWVIATTVLSLITFAQSHRNCYFQVSIAFLQERTVQLTGKTALGYFMQASRVPKRVVAVMNQLGVSVSYDSVVSAVKANGQMELQRVREMVKEGVPFGICWDNLVLDSHKKEETEMNRSSQGHCTTSFVHILHLPKPLDQHSSDMLAYENIRATVEFNKHEALVGLPRQLLYNNHPDYEALRGHHFLFVKPIMEYWPEMFKAHVINICWEVFGATIMGNFKVHGKHLGRGTLPEIYRIPKTKTEIFPLRVFDIDESSIDGNARVIDSILNELAMKPEKLVDSVVFMSGDQMTTTRVRTLKELRIRDKLENRFRFAAPVSGWLHTQMAVADAVLRGHRGRQDGQDPGSINRFATILGRTGISNNVTDFNALDRLITHMLKGHIVSAMVNVVHEIEQGKSSNERKAIRSVDDVREWLKVTSTRSPKRVSIRADTSQQNDWRPAIDSLVKKYGPMAKAGFQRESARTDAVAAYEAKREQILRVQKNQRTNEDTIFISSAGRTRFIAEEVHRLEDAVNQNFILFIRDAMLYYDVGSAIHDGDSGRLERCSQVLISFFLGTGKNKYAREMMELAVDRMVLWTEEAKFIYKNNCLISLTGDALEPVDQVDEEFNKDIKAVYVVGGNMQSQEFQKVHVPRNLMVYRQAKRSVIETSGAPTYGKSHSSVNAINDILRIAEVLVKDKAMIKIAGRYETGPSGSLVNVSRVTDAIGEGGIRMIKGDLLEAVKARRKLLDGYPDIPAAAYHDLEKYLQENGHVTVDEDELESRLESFAYGE